MWLPSYKSKRIYIYIRGGKKGWLASCKTKKICVIILLTHIIF